ncbi:hypothetical protein KAR91_59645 [Candidatus Pacearchaeota archaeon]|nr:hypothetical protein [Candidatus Pacearchaeota archaeon]
MSDDYLNSLLEELECGVQLSIMKFNRTCDVKYLNISRAKLTSLSDAIKDSVNPDSKEVKLLIGELLTLVDNAETCHDIQFPANVNNTDAIVAAQFQLYRCLFR